MGHIDKLSMPKGRNLRDKFAETVDQISKDRQSPFRNMNSAS